MKPPPAPTLVVAHRGSHDRDPENTLPALLRAVTLGADFVEFDVRRLGDGTLVVHHDAMVAGHRLASLGWGAASAEAARLGRPLARLTEALDALQEARIGLNVELKEPGFEEEAVRAMRARRAGRDDMVTSFLDSVVRQAKKADPSLQTGLILGLDHPERRLPTKLSELFPVRRARACLADAVVPHWNLLRLGFLPRARLAGLRVLVWTVNDPNRMAALAGKVDGIITDDVPAARRAVLQQEGRHSTPIRILNDHRRRP